MLVSCRAKLERVEGPLSDMEPKVIELGDLFWSEFCWCRHDGHFIMLAVCGVVIEGVLTEQRQALDQILPGLRSIIAQLNYHRLHPPHIAGLLALSLETTEDRSGSTFGLALPQTPCHWPGTRSCRTSLRWFRRHRPGSQWL